jgi:hypothetical protein
MKVMSTRRQFVAATTGAVVAPAADARTQVSIKADQFLINGKPTYPGRMWEGYRVEGLLMNSRMVNGVFDDENPESVSLWNYPDTGKWDPDRNTREFVAAMPEWRRHGLLSFDICLQGGNPQGYRRDQPWRNNAYRPDGSIKAPYLARLARILDKADELGMAPMLCLFYFGQDEFFADENAVRRATRDVVRWLSQKGYRNVLIEIANECDNRKYDMEILKPARIVELFDEARKAFRREREFLVGTSFIGKTVPPDHIVAASDYLILHGNGVTDPNFITRMIDETRARPSYRRMPVLFNEDDHYDFDKPHNNFLNSVRKYVSWGIMDIGTNNYRDGYQSVPTNWGLNTDRKRDFFALCKKVTGA